MQSQLRIEDKTASNDQVQVFEAIEGTPLHFSNATSFSDLSVDDIDFGLGSGRISRDSNDGLIQHHPKENTDEQVETRTHRISVGAVQFSEVDGSQNQISGH